MDDMNMEITHSEHRAIVFKMNRKLAASVARYLKDQGLIQTARPAADYLVRPQT